MINRRAFLAFSAGAITPQLAWAEKVRDITWDDLIPPGVPYSEIIGDGEINALKDTWKPVFDENGIKFNTALDGTLIRMPGYIVPLDSRADGTMEFILVPYQGACIHVPPPPPNQLVYVTSQTPWKSETMWDAVWVTGRIGAHPRSTDLAEIGYEMQAQKIELYDWMNEG